MQQTVDTTQIHERTVVGEVLDGTAHHRAFLKVFQQLPALGTVFLLNYCAA